MAQWDSSRRKKREGARPIRVRKTPVSRAIMEGKNLVMGH
jgi:hypothetical protein